MKGPYIIIPEKHQAAPKRNLYLPHPIDINGIYKTGLSEVELLNRLKVDKSLIHGLGLYANKNFKRLDIVWYEKLNEKANPLNDGPLRWTNHSDNPNCLLVLEVNKTLEAKLIAKRAISIGEEITYNYNLFGHTGHLTKCNCGNENCLGSFSLRDEWGERK